MVYILSMQTFLCLTFLFTSGCFIGWIIEFFFRRIVHKTWVNPGFLKGPYLPLYGFGLMSLYLVAIIPFDQTNLKPWAIIIIQILLVTVLATVIEYIAGLIFIKGMHIKLWDYSKRKGNIQGIICPLFTLFWGIIGAVYVIFIHNLVYESVVWFTNNTYYSFFVGAFMGLMMFDFGTSLHLATQIKKVAVEKRVVVKWEELKMAVKSKTKKASFFNPLKDTEKQMNDDTKWMKKISMPTLERTVLVYIVKDAKALMLYRNKKENDVNYGKYIGVGGHIERKETKEQAVIREVKEETGLNVIKSQYAGKVFFRYNAYSEIMHLYLVKEFSGELIECDEGTLSWVNINNIDSLNLWEGDKYFLKPLFEGKTNIKLSLIYKNHQLYKVKDKTNSK